MQKYLKISEILRTKTDVTKLGCIESNVQYVTSKGRISVADIVFEVADGRKVFIIV